MQRSRACVGASVATFLLITGCAGPSRMGFVPQAVPAGAPAGSAAFDGKKGPQLVVTSKADSGRGSLRETVANAKAGSTITFRLPKHAKIALTTGAIAIAKNLKIAGPGTSQLFISANRKSQMFSVGAHVTASISNLTLRNGSAAQGGAIYNAGSLTIDAVAFNANAAPGGTASSSVDKPRPTSLRPFRRGERAIKHARAPRIAIPHSSGTEEGGAIYNASSGKLTVTGSTFMSNSAAYGGAIDNLGTATLTSDTFKDNGGYHGSGSPSSGGFGYGAAVYDSGKITITSCTFAANVAGGKSQGSFGVGGALAQMSGTMKVVNSVFDSNLAGGGTNGSSGTGGAIYTTAGTLTVTGSSFTTNQAGGDGYGYGGAIYADQRFTGSKNKFSQNAAFGTGDSGAAYGGAIYAGEGLAMGTSTFSTNSVSGSYVFGGAVDAESSAAFTSDPFTGNAASAGSGGFAEGGGVYLGGGNTAFTSVTFSTNRASATGAASFASGGAIAAFAGLTVAGSSAFTSNSASSATSGGYGGEGGALAIEQGPLTFTGSITNNSATTQGGGLWVDGVATVTNVTVSANTVTAMQAANDGGGGIYAAYAGTLTMTGSTVASNTVFGSPHYAGGGGIFNAGGASISNSTIENNTSSVDGGGFENDSAANVALANVTIYANTASGNGGSLKNLYTDSSVSVSNSILAGGLASGAPNDVSNDGSVVSGDYNIIQNPATGNAVAGTTTHNLAVDPQLAGLANNGGPTQTSADGKTSPGTGYVPFNNCLLVNIIVDQRGLPRDPTSSGFCDVGAYENQDP